ncbi:nucleoside-diphosphate kinase [Pontiella agarivorans]|uniref:Nucleoside diphosphate kinase n=1 Tax=Pontiella agarivorans TaxID=3038953 RepID=A0ABU5MWY1_9BACT|nr:nucleoside-diphosphate kinase [Pontiella agarivorans]MDZ8118672.1 nucleoside-diphosphate kinase [Pontiella agarivorans]
MSKELGYVLVTPYTLRKSRTGGVLGRLMSRTGLDLVAARMIGPSTELVKRYADLIRSEDEVWPEIREVLSDYIEREMVPMEDGHVHRVLMLLFEGENAVQKLRDAIGGFEDSIESADTIRGTFGDYIKDHEGNVTYFEPAVLAAPTVEIAKKTIGLWAEFSEEDGGILDNTIRMADEKDAEQALVIIKPDNFTFPSSRPGNIMDIFSRTGLRLIGTRVQKMSLAQAQEFYGPVQNVLREKLGGRAVNKACEVLKNEFEFEMPDEVREALEGTLGPAYGDNQFYSIMQYMTGLWAPDVDADAIGDEGVARSMVLVYAGDNAIEKIRGILGPTDPSKAEPGSVRKEYGTDIMVNAAHASDSPENAQREIGILKVAEDTIARWYNQYYA